jgi:hypothetical protein
MSNESVNPKLGFSKEIKIMSGFASVFASDFILMTRRLASEDAQSGPSDMPFWLLAAGGIGAVILLGLLACCSQCCTPTDEVVIEIRTQLIGERQPLLNPEVASAIRDLATQPSSAQAPAMMGSLNQPLPPTDFHAFNPQVP